MLTKTELIAGIIVAACLCLTCYLQGQDIDRLKQDNTAHLGRHSHLEARVDTTADFVGQMMHDMGLR